MAIMSKKSDPKLTPEKNGCKLINELSSPGRSSYCLPKWDGDDIPLDDMIPAQYLREHKACLPQVAEIDLVRHFTRLSQKNFSVDTHFYPLGSCTMKYNPKFNEDMACLSGFAHLHPLQPDSSVQGMLKLLYHMEQMLCAICGMDAFTLQPSAGAHGELTGMMLIRAYHDKHEPSNKRRKVIVPDSSHGTNPSSAHMVGYEVITIPSDASGMVDLDKLQEVLSDETAAFMLTNPNTLGVFEKNILKIAKMVHKAGALLYYDGANLNPLLGICRPGDMGFDVVHVNLHKTFSTPHGGGGPGSGPVGVKKELIPFLPNPRIVKQDNLYRLDNENQDTIGKITAFSANIGVIVRAYAYTIVNGIDGLKRVSESAIINANYIMSKLKDHYDIPFQSGVMHEFVISMKQETAQHGVRALDVAKYLIDSGIHPPTIYFPLIVSEALMIEPAETESKETLDEFISTMIEIKDTILSNPDLFNQLPKTTQISRPDETGAARNPILIWRDAETE